MDLGTKTSRPDKDAIDVKSTHLQILVRWRK
jgi:hypothetical protein